MKKIRKSNIAGEILFLLGIIIFVADILCGRC